MPKFDPNEMYIGRIKQIDIDIKAAIRKKNWPLKETLEKEKVDVNKWLNR